MLYHDFFRQTTSLIKLSIVVFFLEINQNSILLVPGFVCKKIPLLMYKNPVFYHQIWNCIKSCSTRAPPLSRGIGVRTGNQTNPSPMLWPSGHNILAQYSPDWQVGSILSDSSLWLVGIVVLIDSNSLSRVVLWILFLPARCGVLALWTRLSVVNRMDG